MAIIKIKQDEDTVTVVVSLPALPKYEKDAKDARESMTIKHVVDHLKSKGIQVESLIEGPHVVSNLHGGASSGTFIFYKKDVVARKDLTPPPQSAIIEEQPKKKRKRVKRDSKTGNETIS